MNLALRSAGQCSQTEGATIAADEKDKKEEPEGTAEAKTDEAQASDEPKKSKSLSPLTLIIAGVASFVIFLGVFSYMMGVFDPAPPVTAVEDQASQESGDEPIGPSDYVSAYGEAAKAVEEAQRSQAIDTVAELALLDQRRKEIQAEEKKLEKERKELEDLRVQVESLISQKEAVAAEKLSYIAKLLDGMKPDEMSGLIENLDNPTIMSVLPRMKPQTASRVLATLPPERAAKITMELINSEGDLDRQ